MDEETRRIRVDDVPTKVFETFLERLGEQKLPDELIMRLRQALLEERSFSERTLKAAVLGEDLGK